ncbi:hypothetical protein [Agathobaculum sp.]|uniref:hypothetical protein n=1 Tax=Agathobaculum sp. TaxID=2048138 RepID=UPI003AB375A1
MMLELTGKDILALTNESKRKAVLSDWRNWGIWHKAPEIGLSVYRLDLPDGSFFTASWYEGDDSFRAAAWATSIVRVSISATRAAS